MCSDKYFTVLSLVIRLITMSIMYTYSGASLMTVFYAALGRAESAAVVERRHNSVVYGGDGGVGDCLPRCGGKESWQFGGSKSDHSRGHPTGTI